MGLNFFLKVLQFLQLQQGVEEDQVEVLLTLPAAVPEVDLHHETLGLKIPVVLPLLVIQISAVLLAEILAVV